MARRRDDYEAAAGHLRFDESTASAALIQRGTQEFNRGEDGNRVLRFIAFHLHRKK